jgi:hypothetical protein
MAATWQRLYRFSAGFERIRFDETAASPPRHFGFLPRETFAPMNANARPLGEAGPHWGAWGRAALRLMDARNAAFVARHGLAGRTARWSLDEPRLAFVLEGEDVVTDLCAIGSARAGIFRWAWADGAIPPQARRDLEKVREFGELAALDALVAPVWPAGQVEALELAAVAARVLYAEAVWVGATGGTTLFFALSRPRRVPRSATH